VNHYTLVNNNDLIAKILNRSVVNYDYFKIYSELLSFEGNEFYTIDYTDIFDQELTFQEAFSKSSDKLREIIRSDGNYMDLSLWDELQNSNVDVIILNLEDEYEFNLTLYLQSIYKNKPDFLVKLVNILHSPTIAMLLNTNRRNSNNSTILSQKLIGEFISQALFNPYTYDIFDEITQSKGNELYILDRYSICI